VNARDRTVAAGLLRRLDDLALPLLGSLLAGPSKRRLIPLRLRWVRMRPGGRGLVDEGLVELVVIRP
jgi:hypothetical protein